MEAPWLAVARVTLGLGAALAGVYAALVAPVALLTDEPWAAVALVGVTGAAVAVLVGALRRHRGALRLACLLYAGAALLLLGQDSIVPAALVALLFAATAWLAVRVPARGPSEPPQR